MTLEAKRKAAEKEHERAPSKAKTKHKKYPLELREEFINEIKNDGKNINEQISKKYFAFQAINYNIVKHINDPLIELKSDTSRKKIPENENPSNIVDIVEKILAFK